MHHAARLRSAIEFRDFFPFDFMRASPPCFPFTGRRKEFSARDNGVPGNVITLIKHAWEFVVSHDHIEFRYFLLYIWYFCYYLLKVTYTFDQKLISGKISRSIRESVYIYIYIHIIFPT